jgi:Domain of unknown function (DUF6748)
MGTPLARTSALVTLVIVVVGLVGATGAAGDPPGTPSSYFLGRGDPRACPSPICGGVWVRLVNKEITPCGVAGIARRECYVASLDLSPLGISEHGSLAALVATGRAVARGTIVTGRVEGFPELATLLVNEIWTASSSLSEPQGKFRLLRDNRRRCVTTPCFSTHAALLNSGSHVNVSGVDLRIGVPARERLCALMRISHPVGLIAAGRIIRASDAGRAAVGRTFVATQFYVRKSPAARLCTP